MTIIAPLGDHNDDDDKCKEGANINDNEPRKVRQRVNICPLLLIMMKIILILS